MFYTKDGSIALGLAVGAGPGARVMTDTGFGVDCTAARHDRHANATRVRVLEAATQDKTLFQYTQAYLGGEMRCYTGDDSRST